VILSAISTAASVCGGAGSSGVNSMEDIIAWPHSASAWICIFGWHLACDHQKPFGWVASLLSSGTVRAYLSYSPRRLEPDELHRFHLHLVQQHPGLIPSEF